jgi:hypothetical protein
MKKIIIFSFLVSLLSFVACDPINDRDEMTGSITADQIVASVTVEKLNGKNVNKINFTCSSPINCQWTNGVLTKAGANGDMLMFTTGKQIVTLTGMCGDGTIIKKEFEVTVDDMHYEVAPEYALFCGKGEKTWTWDDTANAGWGNGGYKGNTTPGWWAVSVDAIEEQAKAKGHPGEGKGATMKFVLNGLKVIKSTGNIGTFSFDMTKKTLDDGGAIWAVGKLYTKKSAILFPVICNDWVDTNTFDILKLTEDKLYLSIPKSGTTGSWGEATFWCFKAVN